MSDEPTETGQYAELSRYRESLGGRGSDLLTTSADAEEVDAYLTETSHRLRTPLSVIVGYTELLMEEGDEPEEVRAIAQHIQAAATSLMEVIEEVEHQVTRERARRRISELLRSLSTMMAASLDFDQVVTTIHECLEEVFDFERSTVLLQRPDGSYEVIAVRENGASRRPVVQTIEPDADPRLRQIERSLRPLVIADSDDDPRWPSGNGSIGRRSWLGAPLLWSDELIGVLTLETAAPGRYDSFDAQLISSIGTQAGLAIVNARQYGEAKTRAEIDGLTGAVTRRKFMELAEIEVRNAIHNEKPLSLLMVDLDHFKEVNDTYGHAAGDFVLNETCARWERKLRARDVVGRYGGEEFFVLLPGIDLDGALPIAERLRDIVEAEPYAVSSHVIDITTSIGVAELTDDAASVTRLVEEADVALYKAKRLGRNRVEHRA